MGKSARKKRQAALDRDSKSATPQPTPALDKETPYYMICALIVVATLAVYGQAVNFDFIDMDDYLYVTNNSHVKLGLTGESVHWAFTGTGAGNWHPLTWLSLMLDHEISAMDPFMYHVTNVILHLVNTVLLLMVLYRLTGFLWRSAFVAALFALHPLHVESVAWISERKDVLSTFFWLLAIWAYFLYAKRPVLKNYLLVALAFILGLMSKPMVVTLPVTLLLLDLWPLGRFTAAKGKNGMMAAARGLVLEKVPLFAISAASCVVTFYAQRTGAAVVSLETLPFNARFPNAIVSYFGYIGKTLWPDRLALFYPHPGYMLETWWVVASGLLLVGITYLAIRAVGSRPYFTFGWLWYVITLVPVIGIVQVGSQALADRYTYVPLIGIFVVIAWGIPDLLGHETSDDKAGKVSSQAAALGALAVVTLLILIVRTHAQVGYWRNNVTVWTHAVNVTKSNAFAEFNLGCALAKQKKLNQAIEHYTEAVRLDPNKSEAYNNLGDAYLKQGKLDKAEKYLRDALRAKPNFSEAHCNMGLLLDKRGNFEEAIRHYGMALKLDPEDDEVRSNYAIAECDFGIHLAGQGRVDEAIRHFLRAIEIAPKKALGHYNLGVALDGQGKFDAAVAQYSEAIRLDPNHAEAHNNLGIILGQQGKYDEAIDHLSEALRIRPDFDKARANLAHFTALKKRRG